MVELPFERVKVGAVFSCPVDSSNTKFVKTSYQIPHSRDDHPTNAINLNNHHRISFGRKIMCVVADSSDISTD